MVSNLTVDKLHDFISKDFMGAWDSVASNPRKDIGRGSLMFASQAMNLLEFACRQYNNHNYFLKNADSIILEGQWERITEKQRISQAKSSMILVGAL